MKVIQPSDLDLAVEAVGKGDLVVVPTRRWYMICADASNIGACERIFAGKNRPASKALAYVVADADTANRQFLMTPQAARLSDEFWPGNLALILPWREPADGLRHLAVGNPNALVTCAPGILGDLAAGSPVPIAATTANISGGSDTQDPGPAITVGEVLQFVETTGLDVAYCIDGGTCPLANHLTIVDCTRDTAELIRPGVVHKRSIDAALATMDASRM